MERFSEMDSSPTPSPAIPPSKWNPYVVSFVTTFCAMFLFLIYYRFLKRFFSESPFRNLIQRRRLLNETNPDDPSLQFQGQGLDSSVLYALPAIQFRKKIEDGIDQGDVDCAVCLGEFEEGEWLRFLPNCTHSFHISCIDTWFESYSNCPLCRSHVVDSFTDQYDYSISMFPLMETLRREDALQERVDGYQVLHFESLRNSIVRQVSTNANRFNPDLDNSAPSTIPSTIEGQRSS